MSAQLEPYQDVLMPDDPVAGTEYTFTVPGDTRVVIVSAMCELTTAAGGPTRYVSLQMFTWTGRRFLVAGTVAPQDPASTSAYSWQSAAAAGAWTVDDAALAGMPRIMLLPQCTVTITVTGLQAGDQLTQIALVRELYPPRDVDAMATAYPVLDALQELNVQSLTDEMHGLREDVGTLVEALGLTRAQSERERMQRLRMAG